MITEHTICALPEDHRDWRHLAIKVQRRGTDDSWVLNHCGFYLVPDGQWAPNLPDASGSASHWPSRLRSIWSERVECNGLTAADILERNGR